MWAHPFGGHYIPLTRMFQALEYAAWGTHPLGYHLASWLLHGANALLLFFFLKKTTAAAAPAGEAPSLPAAVAVLFWSLHPLRAEAVAWASAQRDLLGALFLLVFLIRYVDAAREAGERPLPGPRRAELCAWYGVSLLFKASGLGAAPWLFFLDFFPLRRAHGLKDLPRLAREKIPLLLMAVAAGLAGMHAQDSAGAAVSLRDHAPLERLLQAGYGLALYADKTVRAWRLSPLYELPPGGMLPLWKESLAGWLLLGGCLLFSLRPRRDPSWLAGGAGCALFLFPTLGIYQSGPQAAADRYTYVAMAAFSLPVAFLAARARKGVLLAAAGAVALLLGPLTWRQSAVWRSDRSLWTSALTTAPESPLVHTNAGNFLKAEGRLKEARDQYEASLALNPRSAFTHNNLGNLYQEAGRAAQAFPHFEEALRINPHFGAARYNYAAALAADGRTDDALREYRLALPDYSRPDQIHNNMGVLLMNRGRMDEAEKYFGEALRENPLLEEAYNNRGVALSEAGRLDEALDILEAGIRISPSSWTLQQNLGVVWRKKGDAGKARAAFEKAAALRGAGPRAS
jgi:tetratricopeptide (TPR) repeat protein